MEAPLRRVQILSAQLVPNPTLSAAVGHALPASGAVVAVTGAAGYVGSWLVKKLLERGHSVRACVRDAQNDKKAAFLKALPEMGTRLTLHSADMTKEGAYDEIFEGAHTVFHTAEVFMSFANGRDRAQAVADFGAKPKEKDLNESALLAARYIVDSINKTKTVRRLVYTASIASILPVGLKFWGSNFGIDETREPAADRVGPYSYGITKRSTEHFFTYQASISGGKWSVITGNPGDIVGPILAPHQAKETWQGKVGSIIQGKPTGKEMTGRPWLLADVRDVAEAEVRLAESKDVQSGERFILASGDSIYPEDIGVRVMELLPAWDCATTAGPGADGKPIRNEAFWLRVHIRNDKVRSATGMSFRRFEETLKATVESLVEVGGVAPKLKP